VLAGDIKFLLILVNILISSDAFSQVKDTIYTNPISKEITICTFSDFGNFVILDLKYEVNFVKHQKNMKDAFYSLGLGIIYQKLLLSHSLGISGKFDGYILKRKKINLTFETQNAIEYITFFDHGFKKDSRLSLGLRVGPKISIKLLKGFWIGLGYKAGYHYSIPIVQNVFESNYQWDTYKIRNGHYFLSFPFLELKFKLN
jgi:hypothetical protein